MDKTTGYIKIVWGGKYNREKGQLEDGQMKLLKSQKSTGVRKHGIEEDRKYDGMRLI